MRSPHISRRVLRAASAMTLALGTGLVLPTALAATAEATTAGAATAGAATPSATAALSDNGRELGYTAAPGQANEVRVTESHADGGHEKITYLIDDTVPIEAGPGCGRPDGSDDTKVSCTVVTVDSRDPYHTLRMDLADGDDTVALENRTDQAYYSTAVLLGPGNDESAHTGPVDGSFVRGDDTVTVGAAATVFADDGDDTVRAEGGATVVEGGAGDDALRGGEGDQTLRGDDGADAVSGGDGDDLLYGGRHDDVLRGEGGRDQIWGNSGDDELYGGPGTDTLSGGPGRNIVRQD